MTTSLSASARRPGTRPTTTGVTVAVDGTEAGLRAAGWAAHEAVLRGVELTLVHAAPQATDPTGALHDHAARLLARACTVARQAEPEVDTRAVIVGRDPRTALVEASCHAALLVMALGNAGSSPLTFDIAGRAACPVVVVHGGGAPGGPVVAAVRDLATDAGVLLQAHDAAVRSGAALEVVHATRSAREGSEALDDIEERLRRRGAVPYSVHLSRGRPLEVVVARSPRARLLVVGPAERHRHLLGPVARGALRLAGCPVLIATKPTEPTDHASADATDPQDRAELW